MFAKDGIEQSPDHVETPVITSVGATGYSEYLKGNPNGRDCFIFSGFMMFGQACSYNNYCGAP